MSRVRIAFVPGDPNGIGPELTAKVLSSPPAGADIFLIGGEEVIRAGEQVAGLQIRRTEISEDALLETRGGDSIYFLRREGMSAERMTPGEAAAEGGRTSLGELEHAVRLAARGVVDGVCFAPLNKEAMIMGGMRATDELHHIADFLEFEGPVSEFNIMDTGVWTSRVTSHVPLRLVPGLIDGEKIKAAARLIERALRDSGVAAPKVAVAALNPHGGDGGNFGREEIDIIAPAVKALREEGMQAEGPYPADTLFRRAALAGFHGVVTMYHDQGQIAMKLQGFERGVSVLGGLPTIIATPAHGTAFDIVGQNKAFTGATEAALQTSIRIAENKKKEATHEN